MKHYIHQDIGKMEEFSNKMYMLALANFMLTIVMQLFTIFCRPHMDVQYISILKNLPFMRMGVCYFTALYV